MQVTVELPDEIARPLAERQPDLSRAALEATAIEAVRDGVISAGKAAEMLSVSRDTMDGILKRAEVYLDYTSASSSEPKSISTTRSKTWNGIAKLTADWGSDETPCRWFRTPALSITCSRLTESESSKT